MAKSGMNPKVLQYLMGHSDISVTINVYTHISFDDAEEELRKLEVFRKAQAEIDTHANAIVIDTTPNEPREQLQSPAVDFDTGEVIDVEPTEMPDPNVGAAPVQETNNLCQTQ